MSSTKIVSKITYFDFKEIVEFHNIIVNSHAYFRLNQMQRNIYKDETIIRILLKEKPVLIGLQKNNRYAAFFKRKEGYLRIIFEIKENKLEIITFYITEVLPKI